MFRIAKNIKLINNKSRLFHDKSIDHYENPRNIGSFNSKKNNVGTGVAVSSICGDKFKIQIKVNVIGQIVDAKFKTSGCCAAIAYGSYVTGYIKGGNINKPINIPNSFITKYLHIPPNKFHCYMLVDDAIQLAIEDSQKKVIV